MRRWFQFLGLVLLLAPGLFIGSLPLTSRHSRSLMVALLISLSVDGLLCLFTAWGLKRGRGWSRWTALCASAILLPAYPWLTIAGAVGLVGLIAFPPDLESKAAVSSMVDFWGTKRTRGSLAQEIVLNLGWLLVLVGFGWLSRYAEQMGLRPWRPGMTYWVYLSIFLLIHTFLHELGHAAVAWAFNYKIRVFSVGPFTLTNGPQGLGFGVDWRRLLAAGGYMGAVPTSDRNLRIREIAIVAAGPITSLLTGQALLAVFLFSPGTAMQEYWWVAAFNAVIALGSGLVNLIPLGYSDGSMLFHLVLGTRAGRQLLDNYLALLDDGSSESKGGADFDKAVAIRQQTLQKLQARRDSSGLAVAVAHQQLGHALMAIEDWAGAEREFRKCLEFEAECAANPPLRVNVWSGLHRACVRRGHGSEAAAVYASATEAIQARIKENPDRAGRALVRTIMAEVHLEAASFNESLAESADALQMLSAGREQLRLRVSLHAAQARAAMGLGWIDSGLAAVQRAAEIARSGKVPPGQLNLAWDTIADLGDRLAWMGQPAAGAELLREAITHLESGGATVTAARYRIKMAAALRRASQLTEALEVLPSDHDVADPVRRPLLHERAQVRLAAGNAAQAAPDCREALALLRSEPDPHAPEIAVVEALLARICVETGDLVQAESLARQAADVLGPWQHPDGGSCRITQALANWDPSLLGEGIRLVQDCPLLTARDKARILDAEAQRVERHGHREDARTVRRAAMAQERLVGMNLMVAATLA